METKKNAINWFEIPATNIARAMKFYSHILDAEMKPFEMGPAKLAFFPADKGAVAGCVVQAEGYSPSVKGTIVYLNGGKDLNHVLHKVQKAGGKVLKQKFNIGEHGFIAYFKDTEGNKVALHSMN